jgi:general secretion pathway protein F
LKKFFASRARTKREDWRDLSVPLFQYKAVSTGGEVNEGVMDATTQAAVIERLQGMGLIPIRAAEVSGSNVAIGAVSGTPGTSLFRRARIAPDDLNNVTRELATLMRAGLPLDRSFEILINLAEKPGVAELLGEIRNEVRGGAALSKALEQHRDVFSRFYINMVKAGEVGGALGIVLSRLAEHMERAKELRSSVVSAMIYPAILIVVAFLSVAILIIVVVPQFKQIFEQSGKALPLATQIVLATGTFMRQYWPVILAGALLLLWLFSRSLTNPVSRARWDAKFLRWPVMGGLIARIEMARFSRSLGTLLQNGVPLLTGLAILKDTLGNAVFRDAVDGISRELKEGRGMSKPMLDTNVFPKLAVQMISVGEETGKLDQMLFQVADVYDREVAHAIKRAMALVQPILIIGLAILIGGIIMSILVAMFSLMELPV